MVVNASGPAEPRIFDADFGAAFFEDGYAFSLDGFNDYGWLITELNETYVRRQLHPYGQNDMVPEPVTEEDYTDNKAHTYRGRAMLVLRSGYEKGKCVLSVKAEGFTEAKAEFVCE